MGTLLSTSTLTKNFSVRSVLRAVGVNGAAYHVHAPTLCGSCLSSLVFMAHLLSHDFNWLTVVVRRQLGRHPEPISHFRRSDGAFYPDHRVEVVRARIRSHRFHQKLEVVGVARDSEVCLQSFNR